MQKRSSRKITLLACAFFALFATIIQVNAYILHENREINPNRRVIFTPYSGFSTTWVSQMGYSVNQWNSAAGVTLVEMSSSTHDETFGYPNKDGNNYVYFSTSGSDEAIASTRTWVPDGGSVVSEVDIEINSYFAWSDGAKAGCYDLYTAFLHELGHPIGLRDVKDKNAVMYERQPTNYTKRALSQDDKDGVKAKYGWLTN